MHGLFVPVSFWREAPPLGFPFHSVSLTWTDLWNGERNPEKRRKGIQTSPPILVMYYCLRNLFNRLGDWNVPKEELRVFRSFSLCRVVQNSYKGSRNEAIIISVFGSVISFTAKTEHRFIPKQPDPSFLLRSSPYYYRILWEEGDCLSLRVAKSLSINRRSAGRKESHIHCSNVGRKDTRCWDSSLASPVPQSLLQQGNCSTSLREFSCGKIRAAAFRAAREGNEWGAN